MDHYLMWEYKNVNVGVFHSASSKAERTAMLAKGYSDITGSQSWAVKYPTGKGKTLDTPQAEVPPEVAPPEAPEVDPQVAPTKKSKSK
jgi:hypothetical protein